MVVMMMETRTVMMTSTHARSKSSETAILQPSLKYGIWASSYVDFYVYTYPSSMKEVSISNLTGVYLWKNIQQLFDISIEVIYFLF
jgi:xanthine dehydrogenase molybdopterin-binding subunit B